MNCWKKYLGIAIILLWFSGMVTAIPLPWPTDEPRGEKCTLGTPVQLGGLQGAIPVFTKFVNANGTTVYFAINPTGQVFRSDGTNNWINVSGAAAGINTTLYGTPYYATADSERNILYVSTQAFVGFVEKSKVELEKGKTVYFIAGPEGQGNFTSKILKSTDNGVTWTVIRTETMGEFKSKYINGKLYGWYTNLGDGKIYEYVSGSDWRVTENHEGYAIKDIEGINGKRIVLATQGPVSSPIYVYQNGFLVGEIQESIQNMTRQDALIEYQGKLYVLAYSSGVEAAPQWKIMRSSNEGLVWETVYTEETPLVGISATPQNGINILTPISIIKSWTGELNTWKKRYENPAAMLGNLLTTNSYHKTYLYSWQGIAHLNCNAWPFAKVAETNIQGTIGQRLQADASASSDKEGDSLTYIWAGLTCNPVNSTIEIYAPTPAHQVEFTATAPGICTFQLRLIDNGTPELSVENSEFQPVNIDVTFQTAPPSQPPTANAGEDKTCTVHQECTLTGTAIDPEGQVMTYVWIASPINPEEIRWLTPQNQLIVKFIPDTLGDYFLKLGATDTDNGVSVDYIKVTVTEAIIVQPPAGNNLPPENPLINPPVNTQVLTAHGGPDQSIDSGERVVLSGVNSRDPNNSPLQYQWTQVSGPIRFNGANVRTVAFTPRMPGIYVFRLVVTNAQGQTATDEVTITVGGTDLIQTGTGSSSNNTTNNTGNSSNTNNSGTNNNTGNTQIPNRENRAPIVQVTPVLAGSSGESIQLNSLAIDPEQDGISYAWVQISGPNVRLEHETTESPEFTPPQSDTYVFQVTVKDSKNASAEPKTVTVVVEGEPLESLEEQNVGAGGTEGNHQENISEPGNNGNGIETDTNTGTGTNPGLQGIQLSGLGLIAVVGIAILIVLVGIAFFLRNAKKPVME